MAKKKRKQRNGKGREGPSTSRDSSADGAEEGKGRKAGGGGGSLLEWAKSMAVAFVLFLFIRAFLIHTFVIISGSMEDTLLVGDLLLVNRAALGSPVPGTSWRVPGYSEPRRGDVLVFDPPHEENLKLVKRLIGLPGDTLAMVDKQLFVNGEPLAEPYAQHEGGAEDAYHPWMVWQEEYVLPGAGNGTYRPTRDNWGPLVVPEGHYFMLGDNRDLSLDSRYWGLLERWRLEGRAVFIYFSYDKQSLQPFPWIREVRWDRIGDLIR
jgi:signal peptidase I